MWIIVDERDKNRINAANRTAAAGVANSSMVHMAEYIVVIKDDTYEIMKDRFGDAGEYPLDELPNELRTKLIDRLKTRDQVFTDD